MAVRSDVEAAMATARTRAAFDAAWFKELERIWQELETPPGARAELLDGEIVVSPTGSVRHSGAISALIFQLVDLARSRNWDIHTNLTTHIRATRERLIPDLMVAPKGARQFGDNELLASGVLLAAEVVSPGSQRRDRKLKPRAYAQGAVPLYLITDHFATPPAVTLYSRPGSDGYTRCQNAASGQPLHLPEPFGIDLDTARLLC